MDPRMTRVAAGGASALVLLALAAGCSAESKKAFEPQSGSVIAVLCQHERSVVLLDPHTLEPRGRARLKSQSLDMDASGRSLLTAQSGGHDADVGREFGRIDLEAGTIGYTEVSGRDVQTVGATTAGWALFTTGRLDQEGQYVHRVNADGELDDLQVEPGVVGCVGTRDRVWLWRYWNDEQGEPDDSYRVFGSTGDPVAVSSEMSMTIALCGFPDDVVAVGTAGSAARLAVYDARTSRLRRVGVVDGFETGPSYAWAAGRYVAVADGPSQDYFEATRLQFVDRATLQVVGSVAVEGVSAVTEGPEGRVVLCEGDGTVSLLDPHTFEVVSSTRLGDPRGELVDVEYVP